MSVCRMVWLEVSGSMKGGGIYDHNCWRTSEGTRENGESE